jgi:hypothetical protein
MCLQSCWAMSKSFLYAESCLSKYLPTHKDYQNPKCCCTGNEQSWADGILHCSLLGVHNRMKWILPLSSLNNNLNHHRYGLPGNSLHGDCLYIQFPYCKFWLLISPELVIKATLWFYKIQKSIVLKQFLDFKEQKLIYTLSYWRSKSRHEETHFCLNK